MSAALDIMHWLPLFESYKKRTITRSQHEAQGVSRKPKFQLILLLLLLETSYLIQTRAAGKLYLHISLFIYWHLFAVCLTH
jgi:hypothetical protein